MYTFTRKKTEIKFAIISFLLLWVDLISKYFFYNLEKFNNLNFVKPIVNTWVSFGVKMPLILIVILSLVAMFLFGWLYHKKNISWIIASLLIAGTLWNFIDRIVYWWVRDFISIGNFPIFNIADILLNIWIFLFFVQEFFSSNDTKKKNYL